MNIFVLGSLNMDLVMETSKMPAAGMTVKGKGFFRNAGGKGANQAAALGKLGATVYMVGAVGDPFGSELKETLKSYRVRTEFVEERKGISSGVAVIVVENGDNRIILDGGANETVGKDLIDRALQHAAAGDFLVAQLEVNSDAVAYGFRKAKEKGMVTVLNPAPAGALPEGVLADTDFFIPNETECAYYTGILPADAATVAACGEKLGEMGVKHLIITMGEKGSAYVGKEGRFLVAACPVEAVDTTAAGDTYIGAFVAAKSRGMSTRDAMEFGSKAAALTVTRKGAQQAIPWGEELDF